MNIPDYLMTTIEALWKQGLLFHEVIAPDTIPTTHEGILALLLASACDYLELERKSSTTSALVSTDVTKWATILRNTLLASDDTLIHYNVPIKKEELHSCCIGEPLNQEKDSISPEIEIPDTFCSRELVQINESSISLYEIVHFFLKAIEISISSGCFPKIVDLSLLENSERKEQPNVSHMIIQNFFNISPIRQSMDASLIMESCHRAISLVKNEITIAPEFSNGVSDSLVSIYSLLFLSIIKTISSFSIIINLFIKFFLLDSVNVSISSLSFLHQIRAT